MFDYKYTETGDIDISDGDFSFTETIKESLIGRLRIMFGCWQGEWQFNESFGAPYRQRLLGSTLTKEQKDAEIIRLCASDPDVIRVVKIESKEDSIDRTYEVSSVIVETIDGEEVLPLNYRKSDPFSYTEPPESNEIVMCKNGHIDIDAINRLYKLMNTELSKTGDKTWWTESWR